MLLSIEYTKGLVSKDLGRVVELLILHLQETLHALTFVCTLNYSGFLTKDRQPHVLADQVGIRSQLNQTSMGVTITKLTHKSLLYHFLICCLMIGNSQRLFLWQRGSRSSKGNLRRRCVLSVHHCRGWLSIYRDFLQLLHCLDTVGQLFSRLESLVHFHEVFVHLLKVLIDELVDNLGRQVNPNVEDSVLIFAFKSLEQVLFHIGHDRMSSAEIHLVPAAVSLAVTNTLSADLAIS